MKNISNFKVLLGGVLLFIGLFSTTIVSAATPNITVSNVASTTATVNMTGLTPNANYLISLSAEALISSQEFSCNSIQNCNTTSNYAFNLTSLVPNTDYSVRLSDSTGAMVASRLFSTLSGGGSTPLALTATISSVTSSSARVDVSVTSGQVPDGLNVLYGVSQDTSQMAHSDPMNENTDGTYDLVLSPLSSCTTYYYVIQDGEQSSTFYTSIKSFQTTCQGPGGNPPPSGNTPSLSVINVTATTVRFQVAGLTLGETYDIYYYNDDSNNSVGHVDLDSVNSTTITTTPITLSPNTYIGKLFNDTDLNSIATTNSFVITGNGQGSITCGNGFVVDPVTNQCVPETTATVVDDGGTANPGITKLKNPLGDTNNSIPKILVTIVDNVILPIAIPFLALAIIWTGFQFIVARGNTEKLKKAKEAMWWTFLGAGVILGAYVIAQVVQSTINEIRGTGDTVGVMYDQNHYDV